MVMFYLNIGVHGGGHEGGHEGGHGGGHGIFFLQVEEVLHDWEWDWEWGLLKVEYKSLHNMPLAHSHSRREHRAGSCDQAPSAPHTRGELTGA